MSVQKLLIYFSKLRKSPFNNSGKKSTCDNTTPKSYDGKEYLKALVPTHFSSVKNKTIKTNLKFEHCANKQERKKKGRKVRNYKLYCINLLIFL
jgi:hypothetical protein